jgi:hypothetical protein
MAPCMSSILALSVSDKIDQYGAYAGFASVLGLAVLSLLYFAQAREVKRLREWAGRSPERAAELQDRAVAAAQQRAIVAPQRPATPVGAPAPAVATDARPAAATPAGQMSAHPPAPAVAPAAAAAATAAGAATATPGAPATPAPAGGAGSPDGPGQPTTAMPAANGAAAPSGAGATGSPAGPGGRDPIPGQPLRVPSATIPPPSRLSEPEPEHRSRLAVFGAIAAIVVVAIVAALFVVGLGGDTKTQTPNTIGLPASGDTSANGSDTKTTTGSKSAPPAAAPAPGTYEVAVLNGTTVPGLARGVATRLQNTKFRIGNVTNAATQDRSATLVEFAPGHRAEADAVAKAIEVGKDSIQQLSPGSKTIAGERATVVVTVGSDQNTSPQAQTTTP